MFDSQTSKLNNQYVSYFINALNAYENIPCVLISKSSYFSKKGLTIRFFCKHKTCQRKYILVNDFSNFDRQVFKVKHMGKMHHVKFNCRRKNDVRRTVPNSGNASTIHVASFANINNVRDFEISAIFENIKQETIDNSFDCI